MNLPALLSTRKLEATLGAGFLAVSLGLGILVWNAWGDYGTAREEYRKKATRRVELEKMNPFPNEENLRKATETLRKDQEDLDRLRNELTRFRVPLFGDLAQVAPHERPQQFQDALRGEVTRVKALAATDGSLLPSTFYLGLGEYENKPPAPEETPLLAKQLTVLAWVADTVVPHKGLVVTDFSRTLPESPKKTAPQVPAKKNTPGVQPAAQPPYTTLGTLRLIMRCSQEDFRQLVNSLAAAPYFLVIEGLEIQNSAKEPPRRVTALPAEQPPERAPGEEDSIKRLPVVVGKETLTVSMKIRMLDFTGMTAQENPSTPKK